VGGYCTGGKKHEPKTITKERKAESKGVVVGHRFGFAKCGAQRLSLGTRKVRAVGACYKRQTPPVGRVLRSRGLFCPPTRIAQKQSGFGKRGTQLRYDGTTFEENGSKVVFQTKPRTVWRRRVHAAWR